MAAWGKSGWAGSTPASARPSLMGAPAGGVGAAAATEEAGLEGGAGGCAGGARGNPPRGHAGLAAVEIEMVEVDRRLGIELAQAPQRARRVPAGRRTQGDDGQVQRIQAALA